MDIPDFGIEVSIIDNRENKTLDKLSDGFMCDTVQVMVDFLRQKADELERSN